MIGEAKPIWCVQNYYASDGRMIEAAAVGADTRLAGMVRPPSVRRRSADAHD